MSDETQDLRAEVATLRAETDQLRDSVRRMSEAEAKFRGLLESAPDAIIIVDQSGTIAIVNTQAAVMFGYTREEFVGQPIELLVPTRLGELHRRHRDGYIGNPHTRPMGTHMMDLLARRKDGSEFPTEISLSPLHTEGGVLITAVVRDITERKRAVEEEQHRMVERVSAAEAAMLQSARLAAVGKLAASIAHEINNPLYAARNCLYLLEEDLPPAQREGPYMQMARDQLARIAGIIERMRDFYRPMRGDMAAHDLNQLIEETLALVGFNMRHTTIAMQFTPDRALPPVVCNGDQLRQVFLNLSLNAIEAMNDGGTLAVRTLAQGSFAVIEIADTGIGLAPELKERIFEPFFTNKPSGTGLGLPLSAHIVTQHGGTIEVESAEGVGTTFRVVLPYEPS
ncbi:MAG TPA: PAS domain S-box protein [Herpetosiphonaceae bacterium]|nr:PAS domain S-box protein [Herpetosiphonaceae bacterium]